MGKGKRLKRPIGERVYTSAKPSELPPPITFTLDGTQYLCRELGPLELSEVARLQGLEADDPRSIAFMAEFYEMLLGAQQYRAFRTNCGRFETPIETFVHIIEGVFEDFTNRPTGPQSESSDGRPSTSQKSMGDSSLRVMDRLEGRPDLQLAVVHAQEVQESLIEEKPAKRVRARNIVRE